MSKENEMQRDANLVQALLAYLQAIEVSKQPEELVLVQPHYSEVDVPNGFSIDGYTGQQIDEHLKLLTSERLIVGQEVAIGIYFDHLTPKGHALLKKRG